jgi:cell wall-associated NlpC family hydrolase
VRRFISTLLALSLLAAPAAAKTLDVGSRGKAVRAVQQRLGVTVDGVYGRATARAVRRFQRRHDLRATGRVDAVTRRALFPRPAPSADPGPGGAQPPGDYVTMADAARSAVGAGYREGASGPYEFDASGFIVWAGEQAGIDLPRSTELQYQQGTAVARDDVAEGDLVFFDIDGDGPSYAGIAISADSAISATTHGVREHTIFGPYWGRQYVGARRLG